MKLNSWGSLRVRVHFDLIENVKATNLHPFSGRSHWYYMKIKVEFRPNFLCRLAYRYFGQCFAWQFLAPSRSTTY